LTDLALPYIYMLSILKGFLYFSWNDKVRVRVRVRHRDKVRVRHRVYIECCSFNTGADLARKFRGGDFSNI